MTKEAARKRILKLLSSKQWNVSSVQQVIDDFKASDNSKFKLDDDEVLFMSAKCSGTSIGQMLSSNRKRKNIISRQICYYILKGRGYTLEELAKKFNKEDHSCVHSALKCFDRDIKQGQEDLTLAYNKMKNLMK